MRQISIFILAVLGAADLAAQATEPLAADAPDPRLRDEIYDGRSVITIDVRRGVATEIDLEPAESIAFAATCYGSDCEAKESEASWCIAAIPGQHVVFVKPRSSAVGQNNLQVVTQNGHSYSFVFALLGASDPREPVHRLAVRLPKPPPPTASAKPTTLLPPIAAPTSSQLVADRLSAVPKVVNAAYSVAVGKGSEDILPSLVFDDGRFTYLRFAGNREIPAVFQRTSDGVESMVNAEMEGDLLRVDRVGRQFYLRMGNQAVRVWNDAFDTNGRPPAGGTTVDGVERVTRVTRKDAAHALGEPQ
jgi:type IV secretion system protein VirB9